MTHIGVFASIAAFLMSGYGLYLMIFRENWRLYWHPWMRIVLYSSLAVMLVYLTKVIWMRG